MRTLRFRPSLSLPTCIHRKISDDRSTKRTLEVGEYPMQVLETRRKERLAELKAECLELKNQLSSEQNLQAALLREVQTENGSMQNFFPDFNSKSNGLGASSVNEDNSSSAITEQFEERMRVKRQERLRTIRRELEEFAIKYSLGEYAEKIEGLDKSTSPLRKSKSEEWNGCGGGDLKVSGSTTIGQFLPEYLDTNGSFQSVNGMSTSNATILLRIQKQREQELQRARMELKHLAFRLKHKLLDEEN